jgi:hypothetical protein
MLTKVSDSLLIDLKDVVSVHLATNGTISSDPNHCVDCIVQTQQSKLQISKDAVFTFNNLTSMLVGRGATP